MKNTSSKILIAVAIVIVAYAINEYLHKEKVQTEVIVSPAGKLKGTVSASRDGREFNEFVGIPYAKPPVGELRFESPQPLEPWEGVLNAKKYGEKCPQLGLLFQVPEGSEDCLFLNVYTPKLPAAQANPLLPVMVFFHGGIYAIGAGSGYRPELFMDEDVVLVTVNYRLNSFGFLNTGDGVVAGNMGLKDQTMSLRWVQTNIRSFGGDPNQVTIFGESAGAASAHLHMFSPMSKGLFHRAISQSGNALSPWTIWSRPAEQAKLFASKLDCPTDKTKDMVACMKNLSMEQIMIVHKEMMVPMRDMIKIFVPTIDSGPFRSDSFLPAHPKDLLKLGKYNKVPWIGGANAQDGLIFSSAIIRNDSVRDALYYDLESVMPNVVFTPSDPKAAEKLKDFYMPKLPELSDLPSFIKMTDMFTDRAFFNGLHDAARRQAGNSTVYTYYYDYQGEFQLNAILIAIKRQYPVILELLSYVIKTAFDKYILRKELPVYGVGHADELALMFHIPWITYVRHGQKDYAMSKALVRLWASFAQNKSPLELFGAEWSPVKPGKGPLRYMRIDRKASMIDDPLIDRYNLWKSLNLTTYDQ